jgi:hypothetical protein
LKQCRQTRIEAAFRLIWVDPGARILYRHDDFIATGPAADLQNPMIIFVDLFLNIKRWRAVNQARSLAGTSMWVIHLAAGWEPFIAKLMCAR